MKARFHKVAQYQFQSHPLVVHHISKSLTQSNHAHKICRIPKTHENVFSRLEFENDCMMHFFMSISLKNSSMHSSIHCLHTHEVSSPKASKKMKTRFHLFLIECTNQPHIPILHHSSTPNMGFIHTSTSKKPTRWMKTWFLSS